MEILNNFFQNESNATANKYLNVDASKDFLDLLINTSEALVTNDSAPVVHADNKQTFVDSNLSNELYLLSNIAIGHLSYQKNLTMIELTNNYKDVTHQSTYQAVIEQKQDSSFNKASITIDQYSEHKKLECQKFNPKVENIEENEMLYLAPLKEYMLSLLPHNRFRLIKSDSKINIIIRDYYLDDSQIKKIVNIIKNNAYSNRIAINQVMINGHIVYKKL